MKKSKSYVTLQKKFYLIRDVLSTRSALHTTGRVTGGNNDGSKNQQTNDTHTAPPKGFQLDRFCGTKTTL